MNINYKDYINDIPDFPIDGILYRDIQPLSDNIAFKSAIKDMGKLVDIPDYWVGIESRGFLFALAHQFGGGIRIIRKKVNYQIEVCFL